MAKHFERLYVILVLVFMTSAFYGLSTTPIRLTERLPGTAGQLALQIFVYLPAGILILRHWRSFLRGLTDCKWAIALIGLALTSGLWASDPLFVFRKGLILVASTAFGIYFGTRYRRDEQVALVCYAISLLGAVSLVTVVFFPQYGIDHFVYSGDWRGVFPHKNVLGKVMVLGALALCLSSRKWVKNEVLRFVWLVGLTTLIVLSRSMTAAVVGAVLLVLVLTYTFLRSPVTLQISIVAMVLVVLVAVVTVVEAQPDVPLALLGRDATFTGRTGLWTAVLAAISRKPLLGYGYESFWNGLAGPSASVVAAVHWIPPHAHNGFLDLWLDLGALGVLIFGIGFVLRFRTAILEYRVLGYRTAMWPLAFLSFLLFYNLTENSLLRMNSLYWALYMASLVREVNCGRSSQHASGAISSNSATSCPVHRGFGSQQASFHEVKRRIYVCKHHRAGRSYPGNRGHRLHRVQSRRESAGSRISQSALFRKAIQ